MLYHVVREIAGSNPDDLTVMHSLEPGRKIGCTVWVLGIANSVSIVSHGDIS